MALLILIIGHLVTITPPTVSQNQNLPVVSIDSLSVETHTKFILPVRFAGLDTLNVSAYQFSLQYDPSLLTVDSVSTSGTVSESALVQVNNAFPGILHVAAAHSQPLPASGTLIKLYCTTLDTTGLTSFYFDSFQLNEGEIALEAIPGKVNIEPSPSGLTISADSIDVFPDQVFNLPISIDVGGTPVYSGTFTIQYAPELVTPIDISLEETLLNASEAFVDYTIHHPGHLQVVFASSSALPVLNLPLVRLLFESKAQYGESIIGFTDVSINELDSPISTQNGTVSIIPPFDYGDTNEDLAITVADALLVLRHLLQLATLEGFAQQAADVSGNDSITSYDASLILQYTFGYISCFPADQNCSARKHQRAVENTFDHQVRSFSWENRNSFSPRSTLILDKSEHTQDVYSLDISIPSEADWNSLTHFHPNIPEGWIGASELSGEFLHIKLAGPSPLPEGPVFSIQGFTNSADILINGLYPTSISEKQELHNLGITAFFPTPFDHSAEINYSLGHATEVTIALYDILGRRVNQIFSNYMEAGEHQLDVDGLPLSSGVYLIQITTPGGLHDEIRIIKR